ncbi:MAG: hypothetical protein JWR68_970 [Polaromonas sp.]|nr:hypothetical protein [Polaromonas sp.]
MQQSKPPTPAGDTISHFEYASKGPAVTGASRLVSLTYLGFAQLRAYRDRNGFAWFVLADVFKAIGSKYPATLRKNSKYENDLSQVKVWIVNTVHPEASGFRFVTAMSEGGMHLLLGSRPTDTARALRQWLTQVALPTLRTV